MPMIVSLEAELAKLRQELATEKEVSAALALSFQKWWPPDMCRAIASAILKAGAKSRPRLKRLGGATQPHK
jgi:hypothetical protein